MTGYGFCFTPRLVGMILRTQRIGRDIPASHDRTQSMLENPEQPAHAIAWLPTAGPWQAYGPSLTISAKLVGRKCVLWRT